MSRTLTRIALVGALLGLAACAPEPEPAPITLAPSYNKVGDPVCPAGTVLATDADSGATICVEPGAV